MVRTAGRRPAMPRSGCDSDDVATLTLSADAARVVGMALRDAISPTLAPVGLALLAELSPNRKPPRTIARLLAGGSVAVTLSRLVWSKAIGLGLPLHDSSGRVVRAENKAIARLAGKIIAGLHGAGITRRT